MSEWSFLDVRQYIWQNEGAIVRSSNEKKKKKRKSQIEERREYDIQESLYLVLLYKNKYTVLRYVVVKQKDKTS